MSTIARWTAEVPLPLDVDLVEVEARVLDGLQRRLDGLARRAFLSANQLDEDIYFGIGGELDRIGRQSDVYMVGAMLW